MHVQSKGHNREIKRRKLCLLPPPHNETIQLWGRDRIFSLRCKTHANYTSPAPISTGADVAPLIIGVLVFAKREHYFRFVQRFRFRSVHNLDTGKY
jgi:hypothetical protein